MLLLFNNKFNVCVPSVLPTKLILFYVCWCCYFKSALCLVQKSCKIHSTGYTSGSSRILYSNTWISKLVKMRSKLAVLYALNVFAWHFRFASFSIGKMLFFFLFLPKWNANEWLSLRSLLHFELKSVRFVVYRANKFTE